MRRFMILTGTLAVAIAAQFGFCLWQQPNPYWHFGVPLIGGERAIKDSLERSLNSKLNNKSIEEKVKVLERAGMYCAEEPTVGVKACTFSNITYWLFIERNLNISWSRDDGYRAAKISIGYSSL